MKINSKLLYVFLFLSLMLLIVGCNNEASSPNLDEDTQNEQNNNQDEANNVKEDITPNKGGDLRVALAQDVSSLDPIRGSSGYDFIVLYNIFNTLVEWDNELQAQPGLATSWETPDENTIILHLMEGVTFHDGTPFDAEAVKFNIERANSEVSVVSDLKNIDTVEVIDSYTVKLNLTQPDSSILLALSDRSGMMSSPTAVTDLGDEFGQNPVGTGPFKFVHWIPNGEVKVEANENYWIEGVPYLDTLTTLAMPDENTRINGLSSGEIDAVFPISTSNIPTLERNDRLQLVSNDQVLSWQMYLNVSKPPLDNKKVRQALLYAIDRDALNQALLFGLGSPAHQHFPEGYWAHNPEVRLSFNPEKANQLLSESGVENVTIDIVYQSSGFQQRLSEAVASQLNAVGIKANMIPMELTRGVTEFFSEKRYNAGMWQWSGRPDPQMTLQSLWSKDSFFNAGNFTDSHLEEMILKSASTYEPSEREEIIREVVSVATLDEAMNLPLLFEPATAVMSNNVKGYEGNLAGKPKLAYLWLDE
ncbi:hypothetical protein BTR23_20490 [Alkalihalophilus pseudofirmus]|nr:hypothetical protein BTR23_20490 [Alkalihalophilus pseudofirmus]